MSLSTDCHEAIEKLRGSIQTVFLGKPEVVEEALVALFAQGHILVEDVPGVGKSLLARAIARSIDCGFRRIQFTPDLLPSDITGSTVFDQRTGDFVFKPGPLFANVVLADEINRTSPRTQSALLEAMNDGQVSIDGTTHRLEEPFLVLATQNPFEFEGTYLLPESQLDRFMIRLKIGYPPRAAESKLLASHRTGEPVDDLEPVVTAVQVLQIQQAVRDVAVEASVEGYLLDLVEATRDHKDLRIGVSTRGALMLYRACQSLALLRGREYIVPDDVKKLAGPVLAHRIVGKAFLPSDPSERALVFMAELVEKIRVPA